MSSVPGITVTRGDDLEGVSSRKNIMFDFQKRPNASHMINSDAAKFIPCTVLPSILIALIIAYGCGFTNAFSGSPKTDTLAVVRGYGVTIHEVNAVKVSSMAKGALVLAGRNEIRFSINESNFNAGDNVDVVYMIVMQAEPGKEYAITAKRGEGRVCAFLIDPATGSPDFQKSAGCAIRTSGGKKWN